MPHISIHRESFPQNEPEERISVIWNQISLARPAAIERRREDFRIRQRLGLAILDLRKCWVQQDNGQPVWAAVCDTYKGMLRFAIGDNDASELFHSPYLTFLATTADGADVIGDTEKTPGIIQPVYLKRLYNDGGVTDLDVDIKIIDVPPDQVAPALLKLECQ